MDPVTPLSSAAAGASRRSRLSDFLGVDPDSWQALLLGQVPDFPMERGTADPGWYKDPAGSGQLRYYDGAAWTWRTRAVPKRRLHSLGLMAARASVGKDQRAAVRRPGWVDSFFTHDVLPASSLTKVRHGRSRSGSVAGMLSLTVCVIALVAALGISWQLWGTALLASRDQAELSSALVAAGLRDTTALEDLPQALPQTKDAPPQQLDTSADAGSTGVVESPLDVLAPAADPAPASTHEATAAPVPATVRKVPHKDIPNLVDASWTAPAGRELARALPAKDGAAYGRIRIPSIGVDAALVSGTTDRALKSGPGVWRAGALPGMPGNATIAAHRTTFGAWFNRLDELKYGDLIYIEVPGKDVAVYEVRGQAITSPRNVAITRKTPGVRLTLSTCHPKYSAAYRLVVQAEMVKGDWVDKAVNRSGWELLG